MTDRAASCGLLLALAVAGCNAGGTGAGGPPGPSGPTGPTSGWPTTPPAQICGNAAVLGAGPTSAPAGAITVPAGDNSALDLGKAGATYWFAPGVHTLGSGEYAQISPGEGTTFVGAPGAIIDGQGVNRFAFTQRAKNVTIRYLTIRNFDAPQDQGVVNHDSGEGWTIERCTVRDNHGAALMLGSNNTVRESCIAVVRRNWVHDNKSVGLWADTNNRNFLIEGNYIADNDAEGLFYEISYNARIVHNTFLRNGLVKGKGMGGFPTGAIYLSESGGDASLPVLPPVNTTFTTSALEVVQNDLEDNWGGVVIWENSDRFCASPANTSSGYCTLYFGGGYDTSHCGEGQVTANLDHCRWKSQNVNVSGNVFRVSKARIGCTNSQDACGVNGVFSQYGTYPSWSPYQAFTVSEAITFHQNNVFENNTYVGDWIFMPYATDRRLSWSAWQAAPYGQDAGSTFTP